ncbi:unnamed protein product, partial [Mesorhabditis spiculigera]
MRPILLFLAALAGSVLSGASIFSRSRHRPPFLLGRPPGGHLRSSYYHSTPGTSTLDGDNPWPWVETNWFTQKLDHFDPRNMATWQQKYYQNSKYYQNQSLIFLMIGGEGPEPVKWAGNPDVSYLKWAAKYGAMVFDLEHRFFGDSWPIKSMEYDALTLCTTQQALADIANFITAMNRKFGFSNPRWVTFGGSYPGSLSAFFRAKYPDHTVGAIASSAPVNLKLDFYEYAMVVEDDVTITDPTCPGEIQKAFSQMQQMTLTVQGRNDLNKIWNLDPPFDNSTTKLDITNFLANVYSLFQGMIQYTYDGQSDLTHQNITARALCNLMTNKDEADPVKRAYNVWGWYQYFYGDPTQDNSKFPNSYWDMITAMSQKNVTLMDENGADRGWMWLCCNEIGFLQTTDQGKNIFGSTVPINYFIDMCTDLFGPAVNVNFVRDNNKMAQNYYQVASEATNIVLPNGSLDPWHALGTYTVDAANGVAPILINGTAHCSDMYPVYDGEPGALVAARLFIEQNLASFIAPRDHTQPSIPTIFPVTSVYMPTTTQNVPTVTITGNPVTVTGPTVTAPTVTMPVVTTANGGVTTANDVTTKAPNPTQATNLPISPVTEHTVQSSAAPPITGATVTGAGPSAGTATTGGPGGVPTTTKTSIRISYLSAVMLFVALFV